MAARVSRLFAGALATALLIGSASGQPAPDPTPPASGWTIRTFTDPLDAKKKTVEAHSVAAATFLQHGREVRTSLTVSCLDSPGEPRRLFPALVFSQTVAIGQRWIRWRIDQNPVKSKKDRFWADGKQFLLDLNFEDSTGTLKEMRTGKVAKVDADLPFAGQTLIEFDIRGGSAAFGKIPCSGTAPNLF